VSDPLIIPSEKPRHVFTFMPQFVPLIEGEIHGNRNHQKLEPANPMKFTDAQISEWVKRHDLKLCGNDARCAFEDAASCVPAEKLGCSCGAECECPTPPPTPIKRGKI